MTKEGGLYYSTGFVLPDTEILSKILYKAFASNSENLWD